MRKGFTLIELLIVVIIIGILATIVAPSFTKTIDKAKKDQAKLYLKAIRTGEKIYCSNNDTYVLCTSASEIKSKLGAEVIEDYYRFSVPEATATTFKARALLKNPPNPGSTPFIAIDQDGTITEGTEAAGSSIRWKTDVKPIENALDKTMKLQGVEFKWKSTGISDIGLIAEDVGKVIPQVVEFEKNSEYAKVLHYDHLVALLIEAIKLQQKELFTLKEEVAALRQNSKK